MSVEVFTAFCIAQFLSILFLIFCELLSFRSYCCPSEMRTTQQGQVYYYNIHTGTSTWHDPRVPRDLGNVNIDDLGPLPSGWELRHTPSGRPYYLDHINRTTQFTDPRLSDSLILSNILRSVLLHMRQLIREWRILLF